MGQTISIVVFTAKSVERILREGGTSAWRVDRNHARQCEFAVCTRNANAEWVEGTEPHHSAFLIGKILDVVPCQPTPENGEGDEGRYLIQFSEFARLSTPDVWKGDRNPIKYSMTDKLGIDLAKLNWEKMPEAVVVPEALARPGLREARPLTMADAKNGLALTLGIAPEAIEITIRA
jgi:hypothetical protein